MRAEAALLSALLVSFPLAVGSFLATDFWRRYLLEDAMESTGLRGDAAATFARGVEQNAAELPAGIRQYCVSGRPNARGADGVTSRADRDGTTGSRGAVPMAVA